MGLIAEENAVPLVEEEDEQPSGDTFLFNNYFSDPKSKGIEISILFDGKMIPFRIKSALTLKERQRAQNASMKIKVDAQGKPSISNVDQASYTADLVLAALVWWPFTYDNGKPVPINEQTVHALDGELNNRIANKVLHIEESQQVAIDPFVLKLEGD
jgi:hypothetical protein